MYWFCLKIVWIDEFGLKWNPYDGTKTISTLKKGKTFLSILSFINDKNPQEVVNNFDILEYVLIAVMSKKVKE